jgi:hypothetical protein
MVVLADTSSFYANILVVRSRLSDDRVCKWELRHRDVLRWARHGPSVLRSYSRGNFRELLGRHVWTDGIIQPMCR